MKNILLSAYACEPDIGSEPGVGFTWALAASKNHNVWVITRGNNIESIKKWEDRNGETGINWIGFDGPSWRCKLKKKIPKGDHWYYSWWQKNSLKKAKELHAQFKFDIAHHITFVTHQYPSYLYKLNIPFVFGPCAGADVIPHSLRSGLSFKDKCVEQLRDFNIYKNSKKISIKNTISNCSKVLVANKANKKYLDRVYGCDTEVYPAMTVSANLGIEQNSNNQEKKVINILTAGRLTGLKAHWLSLMALAGLPNEYILTLVGDGPEKERLQNLAKSLKIENRIIWREWMSQKELHDSMKESDIFLSPSLRDSGGMAILEALRCGCPVVAVKLGGSEVSIQHKINGWLADVSDIENVVLNLIEGCKYVLNLDKNIIHDTSNRFTVDNLSIWVNDMYDKVLNGR